MVFSDCLFRESHNLHYLLKTGITSHLLSHRRFCFFWRILQALPAAEAATGDMDEAKNDVQSLYGRINDLRQLDRPEIEEALRPMYVDYLAEHG